MSKLFIIGNGFDIAHGFDTRYSNFKQWIENQLPESNPEDTLPQGFYFTDPDPANEYINGLLFLKDLLDNDPVLSDEWNEFEDSLASLPIYEKYQNLIDFVLEPDDIFENPSRYDDVCVNDATLILENLKKIPEYFRDWIETVDLTKPCRRLLISDLFAEDSLFINFNYTETLEQVYKINASQICYMHGKRNNWEPLVVGHSEKNYSTDHNFDCPSAGTILDEAIAQLEKDADSIIIKNKSFLSKIDGSVTDIYVYGFSYGEQDVPYIKHIIGLTKGKANWHLSDFDNIVRRTEIEKLLKNNGCTGQISSFDHSSI